MRYIKTYKIFEWWDPNRTGISIFDDGIIQILKKHHMWLKQGSCDQPFCEDENSFYLHYKHPESKYRSSSVRLYANDLYELFNEMDLLMGTKTTSEVSDEICEYKIRKEPNSFIKLKEYMSENLINKLKDDPEIGHVILSTDYNL